MGLKSVYSWRATAAFLAFSLLAASGMRPQSSAALQKACCAAKADANREKYLSRDAAAAARFAARADALLGAAPVNKADWGLLIEDAQTGETLHAKNADNYFVPASNMKLFTTALALAKLGPDYKFHTTIETRGTISTGGRLSGDLILVGRGDPNLSNRKFPYELKEEFDGPPEKALAELADAVVARGVKEIAGDVIGDDSYFPRERYPNGWEIDDMVWEYGAAISAIVVDDNTVSVTLTPGERGGDPVMATVDPLTPDFTLQNDVATSTPDAKSDLTLTREPGAGLVAVRGTLPAKSAPRKLVLAIEEPAQHAASLLAALLAERGVKIDGKISVVHVPDTDTTPRTVLAEHVSVPLGDEVKLINKISQNLHAEMMLRTVARQSGLWSTTDDLLKVPQDFYAAADIAPDDVIQTDGSGLSRHDLITPRAVVSLLKYAEGQTWFAPYYASLPVAGVDGSLQDRMKGTVAEGRIHAKTGSVAHVRTLSGFAELPDGRRLIFSFLSNNESGKNHESADVLNGLCVAMIEEFGGTARASVPARAKVKQN
ncbi:MAG TPA: D-alanyl-D-alanine carboxypeptidase/D-alanyl-D-alanine-endopeptidase [Candidatus Solibacter sp.]|nr:D-alanyl-D-alanine carboxypeptidase/D-alanyl-D-alanine-endopeptidase [Candidatus Solibacter sp.]